MIEICEKAKHRIDKMEEQEKYLTRCFKYLICPRCGTDVDKKFTVDGAFGENTLRYVYKCTECDWKAERNT
jgi:hypothetical protein